jgi:Flp pilus assembly protein TadD
MKALIAVIVFGFAVVFADARAFADMPSRDREKPENPNIVAGRNAIDAKDFKNAVAHLTKAVQEEPNNADAHSMLGYSYRKTGTFDKSMEHYQQALKIDANHRSAHEYLGELYLDMNQPENAEKQLTALKKACPFFGKCTEFDDLKKAIDAYKANKK